MEIKNPKIDYLKEQVSLLPHLPGVYQYFDKEGEIIYIGKAKDLRKRVASYFQKTPDRWKTAVLVRRIVEIKHIVVETEHDALLLENNLIKKYQPRYNVLLKDDKSYPWICIKRESFSRVFLTRNIIKDGSLYFGPYTSLRMANTIMNLIKQLYKLRTCKHNLSSENISKKKFKVCLEHHIGNCKAPCVGKISEQDYIKKTEEIKKILKGNISSVIDILKEKMNAFSVELKFEEAQDIKERILLLEKYQSKSTIVNATINNVDVFSIVDDEKNAYVNFLRVSNGAIIQVYTTSLKKKLDETKEELLPRVITEIRERFNSFSREVIIPFEIDFLIPEVRFTIPQKGDKKKLLELSERNAKYYRLEQNRQKDRIDPERHSKRKLETIKKDLNLDSLPVHIECFDNSNIQGTNPVAACVVFKNAKPTRSEYRHYNIKTVEGANDFASMEEVVFRRYSRLLKEEKDLPQLIVIDGGKGQLSSACAALRKLDLMNKIAIIGIAKKLEEIFFPNDSIPLYLDKNSESLKIIQHLRNEAHRFGINFHRNQRSKNFINSELNEIKGIGEKTVQNLLTQFKSVKNIKSQNLESISEVIGKSKAKILFEALNK